MDGEMSCDIHDRCDQMGCPVVSENHEISIQNEELCIKNEGFCIQSDEFCRWKAATTHLRYPA